MSFKWTRELCEVLLKEYEKCENLYNLGHPDYIKRGKRERSLNELCEKLKEYNRTITVADVRNKIQVIRGQYTKELRLRAAYKQKGDSYVPRLWCFDRLKFLEMHCISGMKLGTIPFMEVPPKVEKKKGSLLGEARAALKYAVKLKTSGPLEETREEIFGKFVALQLKQITDPDIYNETTWAIQVALREGIEKFERTQLS